MILHSMRRRRFLTRPLPVIPSCGRSVLLLLVLLLLLLLLLLLRPTHSTDSHARTLPLLLNPPGTRLNACWLRM